MSVPQLMFAARARSRGGPEVLVTESIPVPVPGPGQVLIRVESASVNFADVKRRRGDAYPFPTPLPYVPGGEVAGTVAALGDGVDGPAVGTPVFALVGGDGQGGYAQYALAFAPQVMPLPAALDADRASVLLIAGATAALLVGPVSGLQPGQSILIPAATGAVGGYALQLARRRGAGTIIAAVGSAAKADRALTLGADAAVDYTDADWVEAVRRATAGRGVDVLLEASGGDTLAQGLAALAPFGKVVVYGAASGQPARLPPEVLQRWLYDPAANQSIACFNLGGWFMERPQAAADAVGELIGAVVSGALTAPTIRTLPLAQAAEAHRLLESRQTSGKLVLKPW